MVKLLNGQEQEKEKKGSKNTMRNVINWKIKSRIEKTMTSQRLINGVQTVRDVISESTPDDWLTTVYICLEAWQLYSHFRTSHGMTKDSAGSGITRGQQIDLLDRISNDVSEIDDLLNRYATE